VTKAEELARLCRRHGVEAMYAFGSRGGEVRDWLAAEEWRRLGGESDVDMGTRPELGVAWGLDEKVRLALDLEDMLGCSHVDLVVLPEADPFLAAEIIRGERLFTRNEYEADEYDLYVLRRAGDLIPLERERMALVLGK
jgi:hypothetical protein